MSLSFCTSNYENLHVMGCQCHAQTALLLRGPQPPEGPQTSMKKEIPFEVHIKKALFYIILSLIVLFFVPAIKKLSPWIHVFFRILFW